VTRIKGRFEEKLKRIVKVETLCIEVREMKLRRLTLEGCAEAERRANAKEPFDPATLGF
jgi:hypothetical protein